MNDRVGGTEEAASPERVSNWILTDLNRRVDDDSASPARVCNWILSDVSNERGGVSPSIPMAYNGNTPEHGFGGERVAQVHSFKTPQRSSAEQGASSSDASPPIPLASSSSSSSTSDGSGRRLFDQMATNVEQRPAGENGAGGVSKIQKRHDVRLFEHLAKTSKRSISAESKTVSSTRSDHGKESAMNDSEGGAVPPLVVDEQCNSAPSTSTSTSTLSSSSTSSKGTRPYVYASAGQQGPVRDTSSSTAATQQQRRLALTQLIRRLPHPDPFPPRRLPTLPRYHHPTTGTNQAMECGPRILPRIARERPPLPLVAALSMVVKTIANATTMTRTSLARRRSRRAVRSSNQSRPSRAPPPDQGESVAP